MHSEQIPARLMEFRKEKLLEHAWLQIKLHKKRYDGLDVSPQQMWYGL